MAISVESRKHLWGLSGGKCAICKEDLFFRALDRDTTIGEEAHIIARSPGGPRREALTPETRIDDPVADGPSLWRIVSAAHSYRFDHPADCSEEELDYLAGLFDEIKDWGEIASLMDSRTEQRDVERSLGDSVMAAMDRSFVLMARRVGMTMTGGVGPDTNWYQAEVQAWRPEHLREALVAQVDIERSAPS